MLRRGLPSPKPAREAFAMHLSRLSAVGLAAAAAFAAPTAFAHDVVYEAALSGAAESPPNASPGTGFTRITFNDHDFTMRVEVTFADLLGTTTASHIHCCTSVAGTGTAGVATQ